MEFCRSISERASELIKDAPMVELRADLMGLSAEEVATFATLPHRAIVTCHTPASEAVYRAAIECSVWAIDIELDTPDSTLLPLIEEAHKRGVRVILSHHYTSTPSIGELTQRGDEALEKGADIIKLITTATSTAEALVPLELYKHFSPERLVAFAMGLEGAFSRRLSLLLGAPYTYVAPTKELATAKGQPTEDELLTSLSGEPICEGLLLPERVAIPASKSEAQRAVLAATLAEGESTLENFPTCGDTLAALDLAQMLGATITHKENDTIIIKGVGFREIQSRLGGEIKTLSVGESALLARLALPLITSLLQSGEVTIEGRGTLLSRSLEETIAMLEGFGAECKSNRGCLPIRITRGADIPADMEIDGGDSSQHLSGLMMASALIDRDEMTRIIVHRAVSRPYIALTATLMEQFGGIVTIGGSEPIVIDIEPEVYLPSEVRLQTDWSSASYFAAAYAIAQSGYLPAERYTLEAQLGTCQADEVLLMILSTLGANIDVDEAVEFRPTGRLSAILYDATHTPDLIPTLAVVALFAEGESIIGGIDRLLNKESNRVESLVENLIAIGADVRIEGNTLRITGGAELHAAAIRTHGDHRIAMAFTIASLFMDEKPTLDDYECVSKSFPTFFEILRPKTV